jgi:hypothetical protein
VLWPALYLQKALSFSGTAASLDHSTRQSYMFISPTEWWQSYENCSQLQMAGYCPSRNQSDRKTFTPKEKKECLTQPFFLLTIPASGDNSQHGFPEHPIAWQLWLCPVFSQPTQPSATDLPMADWS